MVDKNIEPTAIKQDVATTLLARDYKGLNNFGSKVQRIVFENRKDEPFITFSEGCIGTIRTIDSGWGIKEFWKLK